MCISVVDFNNVFVRSVSPAFGKAYLNMQLSSKCPKLPKNIKGKPSGPNFNYMATKKKVPSINAMIETIIGTKIEPKFNCLMDSGNENIWQLRK